MSDNILKLIPEDPEYLPQKQQIEEAKKFIVSNVIELDEVEAKFFGGIVFVDQGGNFETVTCPKCNSDITDWWSNEAISKAPKDATQKYFENLKVTTPCCSSKLSLNDLKYDFPAGFARFSLEIRNPGSSLSDTHIRKLEEILGTTIRKINAHY